MMSMACICRLHPSDKTLAAGKSSFASQGKHGTAVCIITFEKADNSCFDNADERYVAISASYSLHN